MKRSLSVTGNRARVAGAIAMLIWLPLQGETQQAKQTNPERKADSIEVPRSEFAFPSKAGDGRDPFFPLSTRIRAGIKPANSTTPKPVSVSLTLNGISVTESRRYALINGKTFVVGDQLEVPVGDARVRVRCVEIRGDSAVVEVNGSRQELRLKPGI